METNPSKALGSMPGAWWGLHGVRFPPYSSPSGVSGVGAACGEKLRSASGSNSRFRNATKNMGKSVCQVFFLPAGRELGRAGKGELKRDVGTEGGITRQRKVLCPLPLCSGQEGLGPSAVMLGLFRLRF